MSNLGTYFKIYLRHRLLFLERAYSKELLFQKEAEIKTERKNKNI